jgi:adenylate cyclase class 2
MQDDTLGVYFLTMSKSTHREEIEIKLRVPNLDALNLRLKKLRAKKISPRTHESNTLYDTASQRLRRRGQLIRVRTERPAGSHEEQHSTKKLAAILTYKGPTHSTRAASNRPSNKIRSHFKIKNEAEVRVAEASELSTILRALGLRPAFRYEKFRTTYALCGLSQLKVELDETPVGTYLELEGPVTSIDRGARLLGYSREDYLKDSYGSLYLAECKRSGHKPGNMLFPPTKKLR